ncbi:hypothetical protein COAQ111491_21925 [Comamonas aquatilis]
MQQFDLSLNLSTKKTRKREFLERMQQVIPWKELVELIAPYALAEHQGRHPFPVEMLLRIHFMQQWFTLSEHAMEEALHEMPLLRDFAGLASNSPTPDESTILHFRHLLEEHKLAEQIKATTNDLLVDKKLMPGPTSLMVSAMFHNHLFLDKKLESIWMMAADLASYVEKKHSKLVKAFWGNSIPDSTSLLLKALNRPEHTQDSENSLLQAYRDLLVASSEVHDWVVFCLYKIKPYKLTHPVGNAEFISFILTSKNLQSNPFLNYVVPHFFPLQLHCYRLHQMLGAPRGIPVNPDALRDRASKGGKARVIGEDILMSLFSEFLESNAGGTHSSAKDFFHKYDDELGLILQNYLSNYVGKRKHPQLQRLITYDGGLKPDGLARKFGQWRKSDPTFKARWEKLVPPK